MPLNTSFLKHPFSGHPEPGQISSNIAWVIKKNSISMKQTVIIDDGGSDGALQI